MVNKASTKKKSSAAKSLEISLQNILDCVEDELLVIDKKYRVKFVNSAARSKLTKGVRSPLGKPCYRVLHNRDKPCSSPLWNCPLNKVINSGITAMVFHPVSSAGDESYLKITAYPLQNSSGETTAIIELCRDVTSERELEIQILRRHHQLLALSHISSAVSGLRSLNETLKIALDNVLEIINGAIGGILLLDERSKTLSYHVYRGLSAKFAEEVRMPLGEGIAGRVAQTGEPLLLEDISKDSRVVRPDLVSAEGLKGFVSIPLKSRDKVVGVMNLASYTAGHFGSDDVSLLTSIGDYLGTAIEQTRLYARLTKAGERYLALLKHTLSAQEEERKRIARELHDETSQAMTSLSLSLQAIIATAEMKGFGDDDFIEKLKITQSYAVHAGNEIVRIMKELRPTLLDELGLSAAIHRYAKDTLQAKGINITADFQGLEKRLSPEIEVTLFRVAQGLIGNILEHSEANSVSIDCDCNDSECKLLIKDNGKGFNVGKLTRVSSSGRGAGVFTMKERVRLVGGSCRIDSQPGKGTKVSVRIPLNKELPYEKDKDTNS